MSALEIKPTDEQLVLIDAVSTGYEAAGHEWPVFQYVEASVFNWKGLDAYEILRSCPWIPIGQGLSSYGWFRLVNWVGLQPSPGTAISLTVAGMAKCSGQANMASKFVEVIKFLAGSERTFIPNPMEAVEIEVSSDQVLKYLDSVDTHYQSTSLQDLRTIGNLLQSEPALWSCPVRQVSNDAWSISLNPMIRRYAHVVDAKDYVAILSHQLLPPKVPEVFVAPSALSLAEAIDYLNAVWRYRVGNGAPLFNAERVESSARLALNCTNSEEFDSCISALSSILDSIDVDESTHKLFDLKEFLTNYLKPNDSTRLYDAIDDLRAVFDLRAWRQHTGTHERLRKATQRFEIALPTSDWEGTWQRVRSRCIRALTVLREEIDREHKAG